MAFQQVIAQGNLGKDPEVRYAASGKAVTSFSIGVSEKRGDKEETEWFNCTAFDKIAEIVGQYVKKGSQVMVTGRLRTEKYEKDGQTRYSTKVMVDRLVLLGKSDGAKAPAAKESRSNEKAAVDPFDDQEIPF